jgi:hypothetical protein
MSEAFVFFDDPLGCRDDLQEALLDPDLAKVQPSGEAGKEGARAAYRAALCLGRCRLYGVAPGDLGDVLPTAVAVAATNHLADLLADWTEEANHLGERWDRANDPAEAGELCAGLLDLRTEAWAVGLVVHEVEDAQASSTRAGLDAAIQRMQAGLENFDAALEQQVEVLGTLAGTRRLTNMRESLAPEWRADPPWWLGDWLEETAQESEKRAVRTLPGRASWRVLGQLVDRVVAALPRLPALREGALAFGSTPDAIVPGQTLRWVSPEGDYLAEFELPEEEDYTPEQVAVARPLNFTRRGGEADSSMAAELKGSMVYFGAAAPRPIDEEGQASFCLDELGTEALHLRVGTPPREWHFQPGND